MARLYANENFPKQVVDALRGLGHDVITMQETGKAGQLMPDADVLEFASADGRALLTLNRRHFIRLHNSGADHSGIVFARSIPTSHVRRDGSMRRCNPRESFQESSSA